MNRTFIPVYDSSCKKCETTRRKIYKDVDGNYKEKIEIQNCERRSLFGAVPFKSNSSWNLKDLSDIDDEEEKRPTSEYSDQEKRNPATEEKGHFNVALQDVISKLKENKLKVTEPNGVRKIYEKTQGDSKHSTDPDVVFWANN
ncbi:hypothetical protein Bhyg_16130 [Pseudolycoriella hygida]|uniref:Uncharacterized protein n=1 Tax=Pseudolycoriella hygida TaxID=35572 RepID=A0A9Q0MLD6_9DIPT|nr:hypothetical protein Bhyg_16130 [Pseudolycoriella hygida]